MEINIKEIQQIEYEMLKNMVDIFNRHNILYYLSYGSALGAVRHNGPIPWDSDMDILIPLPDLIKAIEILDKELNPIFKLTYFYNNSNYKHLFPRISLKNTSPDYIHIDLFPLIGMPDKKKKQDIMIKKLQKIFFTYTIGRNFKDGILRPNMLKNAIGSIIEFFYSLEPKENQYKRFFKTINKYDFNVSKYVLNGICENSNSYILEKENFGTPILIKYNNLMVNMPEQYDILLKKEYGNYHTFPPESEIEKDMRIKVSVNDDAYMQFKEYLKNEQE